MVLHKFLDLAIELVRHLLGRSNLFQDRVAIQVFSERDFPVGDLVDGDWERGGGAKVSVLSSTMERGLTLVE